MQSKKKVYQLKPTLRGDEAINYLSELIDSPLNADDFRTFAFVEELRAFIGTAEIDARPLKGKELTTGKEVQPLGLHELLGGLRSVGIQPTDTGFSLSLSGQPWQLKFRGANVKGETICWQFTGGCPFGISYAERDDISGELRTRRNDMLPLYFKPADIQALADKLNGKPPGEVQREEVAALRERVQQLEQENVELRAHGAVAGGLTFPYSTPELEAMQQAATQYWAGYSDELRKPTQTEIGIAIAEALGAELTAEKRPPRKASQYATAIQPEQYREV